MASFICSIISLGLALTSCEKTKECDCAPPPALNSTWKIERYSGGFSGQTVELPSSQQHTLRFTFNRFIFQNKISGAFTNGTYKIGPDIASDRRYYGITFTPAVPVLYGDYMTILKNENDTLVLSNGMADGYTFLLTKVK